MHHDAVVTSSSVVLLYLETEILFGVPFVRTAFKKLFHFCKIHLAFQLGGT